MLPQRLDLPFSLVNRPSKQRDGISPELNEVFPGWILYGNYYMIVRNEDKFANRNKSKRNLFEMSVLRPDIIAMVVKARNALAFVPHSKHFIDVSTMKETESASETTVEVLEEPWKECEDAGDRVYLERNVETWNRVEMQIDGLGKNVLTEENRLKGIRIYSFFLRLYLLRVGEWRRNER